MSALASYAHNRQNPRVDLCLGVDIGGTNSRLGVVDRDGRLLAEGALPTAGNAAIEDFVAALGDGCRELLAGLGASARAIGIGVPNGNYWRGTFEHAPNLPWKGVVRFAELVSANLGIPAWLTNDANAAALGELLYGGGRGCSDFVIVTLGTGVGSGFVVRGELLYGHTGFAGELGHVIVERGGRRCNCGRDGCLESYASVTGFVATAREKLARPEPPSALRALADEELTGAAIHRAAVAGDALALETYEETADVLGFALANVAVITSPEKIFLYGGLADSGDLLLEPVSAALARHSYRVMGDVELCISELQGRNGAVLGAAALAFHELG